MVKKWIMKSAVLPLCKLLCIYLLFMHVTIALCAYPCCEGLVSVNAPCEILHLGRVDLSSLNCRLMAYPRGLWSLY